MEGPSCNARLLNCFSCIELKKKCIVRSQKIVVFKLFKDLSKAQRSHNKMKLSVRIVIVFWVSIYEQRRRNHSCKN